MNGLSAAAIGAALRAPTASQASAQAGQAST